jgi:O-antigen/teichoic acid export membrane protein
MMKNIFSNSVYYIFSALTGLVLYPYLVKTLGEQQYGIWLVISAATGYFSLLQFGVPMANVKFLSQGLGHDDHNQVNQVISTNLAFFGTIALVVLLAGVLIAGSMDFFFKIPAPLVGAARVATLIAVVELSVRFVFEVFEGFFHAAQDFVAFNVIRITALVLKVVIICAALTSETGLVTLSAILLILTLIQSFLFYRHINRRYPFVAPSFSLVSKKIMFRTSGYSIFVMGFQVASRLNFQTDSLVIGKVVSLSEVVVYGIGSSLMLYLMQLVSSVSDVLMPRVSRLDSDGEVGKIADLYLGFSRFMLGVVLLISLVFWCYGEAIVSIWVSAKFAQSSSAVLRILVYGYLFYLVQRGAAFPVLMGMSKMRGAIIAFVVSALANLLLSIWWGRCYGITGVAWGTSIPLIMVSVFIFWYTCRLLRIGIRGYLRRLLVVPVIPAAAFLLVSFAAGRVLPPASWNGFCAGVLLSTVSFLILYFVTVLDEGERKKVLAWLQLFGKKSSYHQPLNGES